jgi:hypothetical protein
VGTSNAFMVWVFYLTPYGGKFFDRELKRNSSVPEKTINGYEDARSI